LSLDLGLCVASLEKPTPDSDLGEEGQPDYVKKFEKKTKKMIPTAAPPPCGGRPPRRSSSGLLLRRPAI